MEPAILMTAFGLASILVLVKGFYYGPNNVSEAELARRADDGDVKAVYETRRRMLFPTLIGLKIFKIVIITSALAALLIATHGWLAGFALLVGFWLMSEMIAAKEWLRKPARALQHAGEPFFMGLAARVTGVFRHFAPCPPETHHCTIGSRDELLHIIEHDAQLLNSADRGRILNALVFHTLKIQDVMVPRDDIVTVEVEDTVGPVLLDRLHTAKHSVFVVVSGSLDRIRGFLYMSDAASGHPDIRTVRDALRPAVYYLSEHSRLDMVIAASLQTGRQLFIVVDNQGNTVGLVTLRDALRKLLGSAPPNHLHIATDPKKVNEPS